MSATRYDGEDLGHFEYHGTRSDDPNDIYPHEHRRELRANRVFAAWLAHDDSRAINTRNIRVVADGRKRTFATTCTTSAPSSAAPTRFTEPPTNNHEYLRRGRQQPEALSPSVVRRPSTVAPERRTTFRHPSGASTASSFEPDAWKPNYPNAAFSNLQPDDAFWGARLVSRFSDEAIRAIVEQAGYDDPQAVEYLARTLVRRRDIIARTWLTGVNPIVDVSLDSTGSLRFTNAAVAAGVAAHGTYTIAWARFDNESGSSSPVSVEKQAQPRGTAPGALLSSADFIEATIGSEQPDSSEPGRRRSVPISAAAAMRGRLRGSCERSPTAARSERRPAASGLSRSHHLTFRSRDQPVVFVDWPLQLMDRAGFSPFVSRVKKVGRVPPAVRQNGRMVDARDLAARYMRLVDGFVTTQLLYVAASLDVGGRLAGGPMTGPDLAGSLGVDSAALTRVLRGLVAEGVLDEDDQGRFALTPLGGCVSSLRGATIARGALYYDAAAGLMETVRDGGTSFEHVHGARFFEHLHRHPDQYDVFQKSMAGRAEQEARDVVAAYDFTALRRLVDVGGGPAVLLAEILRVVPELNGVLMDQEAVMPQARDHLDRSGVGDRAECVPGDFFVSVPAGGDAYLLSRVLHDWDDDDAGRILATCRSAMETGVRLLVIEAILPERASDAPAVIRMDLLMLILLGARERTEAEFRNLLASAGFTVQRVVRTDSPAGLGIIEAVAGSTTAT